MPEDVGRHQIDFIMVENRLKNQGKNGRSYSSADIDSVLNFL